MMMIIVKSEADQINLMRTLQILNFTHVNYDDHNQKWRWRNKPLKIRFSLPDL